MSTSNIEDNIPHELAELMCIKCGTRWIGVYPASTLLKDLQCPCGLKGFVIKTGQTLNPEEYSKVECMECKLFVNEKCKLGLSNNTGYKCGYYKRKS